MGTHRVILAGAAALIGLLAGGCASEQGRLVVIGGGLKTENDRVFHAMVAGPAKREQVTIVPTASAEQGPAVQSNVERFKRHLPSARYGDLADATQIPDERRRAAWVASSDILFFTGGDQSRVTKRFRPGGGTTPERDAMFAALARGGVIAGTSAGAAMMSDPMFTGGGSETALGGAPEQRRQRDPDDDSGPDTQVGPRTGQGMGFFPYGMTDSHFFSRGRIGRLIAALEANHVRRGFGVADNRALDVDLNTGLMTGLGDNAALVVDTAELRRDGLSRRGVRITLLSDGDVYDAATGRVTPGGGRKLVGAKTGALPAPESKVPDAWGRDVVLTRLARIAAGESPSTSQSRTFDVVYRADDRTWFSFAADGSLRTAVDVIVDVIERKPSPARAAAGAAPAAP